MRKITEDELQQYVEDVGTFEKEHRKYATFYCTAECIINQASIDELAGEGLDATDFLNVCVTLCGIWDEDNGACWYEAIYRKVEEYQEFVPEQVIPAHYVSKKKFEKFTPTWGQQLEG